MVIVKEKVFNVFQIAELLAYHFTDDDRSDNRDTVRSKHPRWSVDTWPQHDHKIGLSVFTNLL